jgi:hypothetical protein
VVVNDSILVSSEQTTFSAKSFGKFLQCYWTDAVYAIVGIYHIPGHYIAFKVNSTEGLVLFDSAYSTNAKKHAGILKDKLTMALNCIEPQIRKEYDQIDDILKSLQQKPFRFDDDAVNQLDAESCLLMSLYHCMTSVGIRSHAVMQNRVF